MRIVRLMRNAFVQAFLLSAALITGFLLIWEHIAESNHSSFDRRADRFHPATGIAAADRRYENSYGTGRLRLARCHYIDRIPRRTSTYGIPPRAVFLCRSHCRLEPAQLGAKANLSPGASGDPSDHSGERIQLSKRAFHDRFYFVRHYDFFYVEAYPAFVLADCSRYGRGSRDRR